MIVKVQLSIFTNDVVRRMLIYDRTREYRYEGEATPEVEKLMNDRGKDYFFAELVGTEIVLGEKAPWQNW